MKVAIINGSPKKADSASGQFGDELEIQLAAGAEVIRLTWNGPEAGEEDIKAMALCDAVVFAFPLYVDGIPSHLLRILQELELFFRGREGGGPMVYALVNCGFFEGGQNYLALEMVRQWSRRAGLRWGAGLGVGGGPMLSSLKVPLGKGPRKSMGRAYQHLVQDILTGSERGEQYVNPDFPRWLYIRAAHLGWRMEARKNGVRGKQLYRRV